MQYFLRPTISASPIVDPFCSRFWISIDHRLTIDKPARTTWKRQKTPTRLLRTPSVELTKDYVWTRSAILCCHYSGQANLHLKTIFSGPTTAATTADLISNRPNPPKTAIRIQSNQVGDLILSSSFCGNLIHRVQFIRNTHRQQFPYRFPTPCL